ncbi:MAG: methyltransferase domain-containing protein, partial [Acetobacteraceae bacterium]|nr:methyltransferase domain-containing protein [Acetobacteraceae bacterium]
MKIREWVGAFGRGTDARPAEPVPAAAPAPATAARAGDEEAALSERLAVLAALWGDGFTGPGGEEEVLRLAKPLGLSASTSLLHLGAGLGGGSRAIARSSGAYVSGYELDPALAREATLAAQKAGLGKRAAVEALDPGHPAIRQGYFHHALAQEALWPLADKQAVLAGMVEAVKPGGQLMLTDLVRGEDDADDAAWSAWAVLERAAPHLGTERQIGRAMLGHGLDIRVVEDVTQRHVTQALTGWMNRVSILRRTRPTPRQAARLVREAELWLRRCRLMQEGRMRMLRWHA